MCFFNKNTCYLYTHANIKKKSFKRKFVLDVLGLGKQGIGIYPMRKPLVGENAPSPQNLTSFGSAHRRSRRFSIRPPSGKIPKIRKRICHLGISFFKNPLQLEAIKAYIFLVIQPIQQENVLNFWIFHQTKIQTLHPSLSFPPS